MCHASQSLLLWLRQLYEEQPFPIVMYELQEHEEQLLGEMSMS
jgi:hypothetical protein